MSLVPNPNISLDEAKTIKLGGVIYQIAPLMLRQTSVINAMMPEVFAILNNRAKVADDFRAKHPHRKADTPLTVEETAELTKKIVFSEEETTVSLKVIRAALSRLYPQVTLDDLYDMPITREELLAALGAAVTQARVAEKTDTPTPGEFQATVS